MTPQEEYRLLLDSRGVSLASLGLREIGLERVDALLAVEILRKGSSPILGGDVYVQKGSAIEFAYATWGEDLAPGEAPRAYLQRSWDSTETYIRNYPEPSLGKPIFALVVRC